MAWAERECRARVQSESAERECTDKSGAHVFGHDVLALHAGLAWERAEEDNVISIFESLFWVRRAESAGIERFTKVLQLHDHALDCRHRRCYVQKCNKDWLIGAED